MFYFALTPSLLRTFLADSYAIFFCASVKAMLIYEQTSGWF